MSTEELLDKIFEACVAADEDFAHAGRWAAELIARERPGERRDVFVMRRHVQSYPKDYFEHG
jgi:hypothetical protein